MASRVRVPAGEGERAGRGAALPQEDAGPGAAGVGVRCAGSHVLTLQLGLAAVALRAEETPTHEAQGGGSALVPTGFGAPGGQRQ